MLLKDRIKLKCLKERLQSVEAIAKFKMKRIDFDTYQQKVYNSESK